MPTTPYAKLLVSVNAGGNTSGGIEVPSAATIQFDFESTVGWLRARVEIFDYPEGWATPSGWTLAAAGTIYCEWTGMAPPLITLPASSSLWGVWMPRLLVNEQIDDDQNELANLLDDDTALCMLSPSGLRDSGARENQHFTTSTTRIKNWLRSYQRNLRALENPAITLATSAATTFLLRHYPITADGYKVVRAVVKVGSSNGLIYGEYEVKAGYIIAAGVISEAYAPVITTVIESNAGLGVAMSIVSGGVDMIVTSIAGTLTWAAQEAFF